MDDEYGVNFMDPPGETRPSVYFEAVDDEHAVEIMAERWERGEVLSLYHFPRGRGTGTQRRVWPRPRI